MLSKATAIRIKIKQLPQRPLSGSLDKELAFGIQVRLHYASNIKTHIPINGEIDLSSASERKFFLIKKFTVSSSF